MVPQKSILFLFINLYFICNSEGTNKFFVLSYCISYCLYVCLYKKVSQIQLYIHYYEKIQWQGLEHIGLNFLEFQKKILAVKNVVSKKYTHFSKALIFQDLIVEFIKRSFQLTGLTLPKIDLCYYYWYTICYDIQLRPEKNRTKFVSKVVYSYF